MNIGKPVTAFAEAGVAPERDFPQDIHIVRVAVQIRAVEQNRVALFVVQVKANDESPFLVDFVNPGRVGAVGIRNNRGVLVFPGNVRSFAA